MCLRIGSCCGKSLRFGAVIVGIFTLLEAIALIIAGGFFLYQGFKVGDFSQTSNWRLPYRFDVTRAFGGLYLAFGALWLVITLIYAAAVYTERAMYILPWLVLQAVSLGLGLTNMISNAAYRDYQALAILPFLFVYLMFYMVVFSYYMELQEMKQREVKRYQHY